ncbi:MAG TPA: alkaline phosphatase family protein, partial [Candidatus Baltobacteraceae bacterium]|nr:alkaline phosphatase family protein [Candidatus Baltobacteraceae bacterium]
MNYRRCLAAALAAAWVLALGGQAFAKPINIKQRQEYDYTTQLRAHIKHIVVIIQENRSVDNLFHGFPGADTVDYGLNHTGYVKLHPVSLGFGADVDHQHKAFVQEYDGGRMDGWDRVATLPRQDPNFPYAYVPRNEVEPYFDMAQQYTFADRMFQSNTGPTFPAHLYLIAGQSEFAANNPNELETTR